MRSSRPFAIELAFAALALLLVAPISAGAESNHLGLIPSPGVKFGIVRRVGSTIRVQLERARLPSTMDNESALSIRDVAPGTGAVGVIAPVPPTPFDEYFPNGAYAFEDPNHDLLAAGDCVQAQNSGNVGWDNNMVYCDKAGVKRIKIKTGSGQWDFVNVDDAVTAPLKVRCGSEQSLCGTHCVSPEHYSCCDPVTGCVVEITDQYTCADITCP